MDWFLRTFGTGGVVVVALLLGWLVLETRTRYLRRRALARDPVLRALTRTLRGPSA